MSYTPPVGNATTTKPGLIQLSGDLSGTATNPTINTGVIDSTNLATNAVTSTILADSAVTEPKLAVSNAPSTNQVLSWNGTDMTWVAQSATPPDATTGSKGIVQLAGDLAGTATAPTVPGLAGKASLTHTHAQSDVTGLVTALSGKADDTTTITGTNSITGGGDLSANRTLGLVGDVPSPGIDKYYGTDTGGIKGWYSIPGGSSSVTLPGIVQLDDFAGATDDDKLTAALTFVQAQTYIPAIQLPSRQVTFAQTRTPFSGLKIIGPGPHHTGPKNLELASGKYSYGQVRYTGGNGTSSWWYGTGTYYDVFISNLAIWYTSGTGQFWHQPNGTLYACEFHSLTHYGAKHVFGQPASKALVTQVVFSGHWTCIGFTDTQFTLGGSDCSFWMDGYINIGPPSAPPGAGKAQIIFDNLSKTTVGYMYVTCNDDWGGITLKGNATNHIKIFGGSFEGMNNTRFATRPVIKVEGGNMSMYSPWTAYVANSGAAVGVIEQTGGNLTIYSPAYHRTTSAPETFPFLYQTGGTFQMIGAPVNGMGEQYRIRWSDGSTVLVANPANTLTP